MPIKKAVRKPKRPSARSGSKQSGKNKTDRAQIMQTFASNCRALSVPADAQSVGVSLIPSPRAMVSAMKHMFDMEFPKDAHRAQFSFAEDI
jgi:hypothetical protein